MCFTPYCIISIAYLSFIILMIIGHVIYVLTYGIFSILDKGCYCAARRIVSGGSGRFVWC